MKRFFFFCSLLVFCSFHLGLGILPAFSAPIRALWITRWDYQSPDDIRAIMKNVRSLGVSDVLFQIRGNATAYYPSAIEPWAGDLTGDACRDTGKNPGWDPLQTALDEARAQHIKLHAWMNVFPAWRGKQSPPRSANQLWTTHRSWFIVDHTGSLLYPQETGYTFLSPGNPSVRNYLASVFGEVAKKYPSLDGIHMDYIRYPVRSEYGGFRDFSHDPASLEQFRLQYGKKPRYDMPEWHRFKCDSVSNTIQAIRAAIHESTASIQLSATFMAEIHRATEEAGQNPSQWLEQGLVDWVVPMVYKRSSDDFIKTLDELDPFINAEWAERMVIGINADFNNSPVLLKQMQIAAERKNGGQALFAYATVYPNHTANRKAPVIQSFWQELILKSFLGSNDPALRHESSIGGQR